MKTIEERAKEAGIICQYKSDYPYDKRSVEYDGFSYYYNKNIYDTLIEGIEHLIKEGYFNKEYLV